MLHPQRPRIHEAEPVFEVMFPGKRGLPRERGDFLQGSPVLDYEHQLVSNLPVSQRSTKLWRDATTRIAFAKEPLLQPRIQFARHCSEGNTLLLQYELDCHTQEVLHPEDELCSLLPGFGHEKPLRVEGSVGRDYDVRLKANDLLTEFVAVCAIGGSPREGGMRRELFVDDDSPDCQAPLIAGMIVDATLWGLERREICVQNGVASASQFAAQLQLKWMA